MRRVQGDVGPAGLEHPQRSHHHLERALRTDPHQDLRADAARSEMAGELVGSSIEAPIGQLTPLAHHRHRLRCARHLGLEELVEADGSGVFRARLVPRHQELPALGVGQERHGREAPPRVRHDARQEDLEVPQQTRDGRGVEEVGVVLDRCAQPFRPLGQGQGQVELRRVPGHLGAAHGQARQLQRLHRGVLEVEQHLKQGRPARDSARAEAPPPASRTAGPDGRTRSRATSRTRPSTSRKLGLPARLVRSTRVLTKKPIRLFELRPRAPGDGRAHHDVVLPRVAVQQRLEGGQQGHEEGRALALSPRALSAAVKPWGSSRD